MDATLDPTIRRRLLSLIDGAERLRAEYEALRGQSDRLRDEMTEVQRRLGRFDPGDLERRRHVREEYDRIQRELEAIRSEFERVQQLVGPALRRAHDAIEPIRSLVLHFAPGSTLVIRPDWRPDLEDLRLMVVKA